MLRGNNSSANANSAQYSSRHPLRVFGFGTIFITQRLLLHTYPEAGTVTRAHNVHKTRGGHSANVLAILAQFRPSRHTAPSASSPSLPIVRMIADVQFCGPLSGSEEGALISKELDSQGISTMFSVIREGKNVPIAWVIEAADGTRTVINHNPLPDMTHEEFVSRLGPVLAPENYDIVPSAVPPHPVNSPPTAPVHNHLRKHSGSGPQSYGSPPNGVSPLPNMASLYQQFIVPGMPPFDWMHFEGRSFNTLHSNLTGLDGLARERGWRSRCVFSLQVSRTGVEPLMQHADVIFFSKPYAQTVSPSVSPRALLISMCAHASSSSLLVADWGSQGAALLSVPTREYFQSSGWVEPSITRPSWNTGGTSSTVPGSIVSSSNLWMDGRSMNSDGGLLTNSTPSTTMLLDPQNPRNSTISAIGSDSSRASTETEKGTPTFVDEVGAHDAFVAGMIFALSQNILPGRPYTSSEANVNGKALSSGVNANANHAAGTSGKWKLEECLRFATELAGRKGRKSGLQGLRSEMERGGWNFE